MSAYALTAKQAELLDYLKSCERCPSFQEMTDALGLKSKAGIHRLVDALEERGFITRRRDRARSIEVVDQSVLSNFSAWDLATELKMRGFNVFIPGNLHPQHKRGDDLGQGAGFTHGACNAR